MLSRRRQVAAAIEASEGTPEMLTSEHATINAYDPKITFDVDASERAVCGLGSSQLGKIPGKRTGTLKIKTHVSGSGKSSTDPEWIKYLRAGAFSSNIRYGISIGAITSGPFQHGEKITGGTSNATGIVIKNTPTGASTLFFVETSATTFQSGETITGSSSGATATTSSVPSASGKVFLPIVLGVPSLTIGSYEDGVVKLLKGARVSKIKFDFKTGRTCMVEFDLKGVEAGIAAGDLFSEAVRETIVPPAFLNSALRCDNVSMKISEISIDIENLVSERPDSSDASGVLSILLAPPQKITISLDPEMLPVSTYDFHDKWFSGAEVELDFFLGTETGNRYEFYAPKVQYDKIDDEQRDGTAVAKITGSLNGHPDRNDAFAIIQL